MSALQNVLVLMDTLAYFERNQFDTLHGDDYDVRIKNFRECYVLLPEDVEKIKQMPMAETKVSGKCKVTCEDTDTYTKACQLYKELKPWETEEQNRIMVLNFANPYIPGGGVRRGARAQEEDLCRRSSLLLSLETEEAKKYYSYNRKHTIKDEYGNDYGTNSMILTPFVEVIKDKHNKDNVEYARLAVLTVAAPIIRDKWKVSEVYLDLMYQRISSMLYCAAAYGYTHLVLGAWGCGAFGNDPEEVVDLFRDVIANFRYNGKNVHQLFETISFAVPYNEKRPGNHLAFKAVFGEE